MAPLVMLRNGYVAAEAQLQKAGAQLAVRMASTSGSRLSITKSECFSKGSRRASVDAAQEGLGFAASAAQQSWGGAVAGWVANDSPLLTSVLNQQAMLVQLALPIGTSLEPPRRITLSTPSGNMAEADYVSPFPQVDPRIQGISELYLSRFYAVLQPA
jgi:hypothetical protein